MCCIISLLLLFKFKNDFPPGTIAFKNIYVDKTEVLNIHWMEYISYRSNTLDSSEIQGLLPDAANFWYDSPQFLYKPIVLISYEQAIDFCKWRSEIVSQKLKRKITYRLPTILEWEQLSEEEIKIHSKFHQKELRRIIKYRRKYPVEYFLQEAKFSKNKIYNLFDNAK